MANQSISSHSCSLSVIVVLSLLSNIHPVAGNGGARILSLKKEPAATKTELQMLFITSSCNITAYPTLCFDTVSSHATAIQRSPMQLARTALSAALGAARSTLAAFNSISKCGGSSPRVKAAVRDCVETVGDSVDELKRSVEELGHLNMQDKNFRYRLNSIQTWVSAAITNYDTCTDGFDGHDMDGTIKRDVGRRISNVTQLTSNALALINRLATISTP